MNATIKDVAKNAGVSIATVSRVLNKSEKVSKNTREKILKAIVDTGYISTISQKEKTLKSIYVLLPENGYGFFDEFCYGIDEAACLRGYETIITTAGTGKHKGFRIFDGTSRIGATGIITLSPYAERKLHDSTEHKFPAVSIFPNGYLKSYEFTDGIDSPKTDSVGIYTVETANDVFARFASSGRKNIIVFFSEKTYMHEGDLKRAVNSSSFPEKGMRIKLVRLENASPFRAEEKMTEILKKRTCEFSAVFCTSDLMAAGIYRSFRNFSRSMPEEISVIGMGDHDFSPFLFPSLSTISMPKREMGKSAAELLMDKIETVSVNSGTYRNILFPSKLIIRDSLI